MDPDRVRAYLQAACAGLGFDIGEVWFTSNESGTSTVASIAEEKTGNDGEVSRAPGSERSKSNRKRRIKFVQLYTSKSYEDQRSKLVAPPPERRNEGEGKFLLRRSNSTDNSNSDLEKHVLSPRLVESISNTAQVVWANCQEKEGLLGRSDVKLQTAVGMPVAMDSSGNMCIVVMFSPNNVQSNDEALEYLQYISKSAVSSSIPCLLPVIETQNPTLQNIPNNQSARLMLGPVAPQDLGGGVTARFVSFHDIEDDNLGSQAIIKNEYNPSSEVEIHTAHELSEAPKDCFGIPMLPTFAELGCASGEEGRSSPLSQSSAEAFDEASYGVWSTIMNTPVGDGVVGAPGPSSVQRGKLLNEQVPSQGATQIGGRRASYPETTENGLSPEDDALLNSAPVLGVRSRESSSSTLSVMSGPFMPPSQKGRLEEFVSAFLGMSVFDAADVWIPCAGDQSDNLGHILSVSVTDSNEALNNFKAKSAVSCIKIWSGAVGRAYGSGSPVWSANKNVIIDTERAEAFVKANIQTALAVPIFSTGSMIPACVLCCYSPVRTDSVPFVLRFVQQALRLLWHGLDHVEPHESVGKDLWKDVAPADLGEMAADVEMQQAFYGKKRPHNDISQSSTSKGKNSVPTEVGFSSSYMNARERSPSLALQLQALKMMPPEAPVPLQASPPVQTPPPVQAPPQPQAPLQTQAPPQPQAPLQTQAPPRPQASQPAQIPAQGPMIPPPKLCMGLAPAPILPTVVVHPPPLSSQEHNLENEAPVSIPLEKEAYWAVQDAVRSVGDAVPWSVHKSVPTNEEGTKRAHTMSCVVPDRTPSSDVSAHIPPPQNQPLHEARTNPQSFPSQSQHQPVPLSHVDHRGEHHVPTMVTSQAQPVAQRVLQHPPRSNHREDPAVALANIEAFNELARMQGTYRPQQTQPDGSTSWGETAGPNYIAQSPNPSQAAGTTVAHANGLLPMTADASSSYGNATPDAVRSTNNFCQPIGTTGTVGLTAVPYQPSSGKPCRIQGCNDFAIARRPYCLRHSGNRQCEHDGCTKCAQGSTRFCIAHGGGRRCTFPGCDKGARDKLFCAAHGGGKRCSAEGCSKSAVGGSSLCTSHGGGRRCAVEGCIKSAQSSTKFCVKHGGGKKCAHSGCEKVARGRTLFCAAHGGGIRCKLEGCNRVSIGKAQLCRAHGGGSSSRSKMGKKAQRGKVSPQLHHSLGKGSSVTRPSGTPPPPAQMQPTAAATISIGR